MQSHWLELVEMTRNFVSSIIFEINGMVALLSDLHQDKGNVSPECDVVWKIPYSP